MSAYRQNGGDAAKAIQAGASAGEKLTAQAAARAPKAARWGISMKHYLQEFYKAPEEQKITLAGQVSDEPEAQELHIPEVRQQLAGFPHLYWQRSECPGVREI